MKAKIKGSETVYEVVGIVRNKVKLAGLCFMISKSSCIFLEE